MGHKVFVSYKYADDSVQNLSSLQNSTVRDYVTEMEQLLGDNIYKGEPDDQDLSYLSEESLKRHLSDRLRDSSVTVVCISPNMKDLFRPEEEQWIPWEISYSLRETTRTGSDGVKRTCHANGIVAVVLPDRNGCYDYYLEPRSCCPSCCTTHKTQTLFEILRNNKFNKLQSSRSTCDKGDTIWHGECSYIEAVKWCDFVRNPNHYIEKAHEKSGRIDEFNIRKNLQ